MGRESPSWESELWSYVCSGDGEHCPVHNCCQNRLGGGWCAADNIECLNRLLDEGQFDAGNFNSIEKGCGRICQLVGRLTQSILEKNKIYRPPVPTELVSLFDEERPVEVRLIPLKSYHGAIWRLENSWVI